MSKYIDQFFFVPSILFPRFEAFFANYCVLHLFLMGKSENLKILLDFFFLGAARPLTQLKSPSNQSYPQQPTIISIVYTPFQRREKKTLDLIWKYLNALQNLQFCAFVTFHYNLAMINIALPVKQRNVTLLTINRPEECNV